MPNNDPFRDPEVLALRLATTALTLVTAGGLIGHEWRLLVGDTIPITPPMALAAWLALLWAMLRTRR